MRAKPSEWGGHPKIFYTGHPWLYLPINYTYLPAIIALKTQFSCSKILSNIKNQWTWLQLGSRSQCLFFPSFHVTKECPSMPLPSTQTALPPAARKRKLHWLIEAAPELVTFHLTDSEDRATLLTNSAYISKSIESRQLQAAGRELDGFCFMIFKYNSM